MDKEKEAVDNIVKFNQNRLLNLIKEINLSFVGSVTVYTQGSCYQFYKILKTIFNTVEPYYNGDHVVIKYYNKYYDITGELNTKEIESEYIHLVDKLVIQRLEEDIFNIFKIDI